MTKYWDFKTYRESWKSTECALNKNGKHCKKSAWKSRKKRPRGILQCTLGYHCSRVQPRKPFYIGETTERALVLQDAHLILWTSSHWQIEKHRTVHMGEAIPNGILDSDPLGLCGSNPAHLITLVANGAAVKKGHSCRDTHASQVRSLRGAIIWAKPKGRPLAHCLRRNDMEARLQGQILLSIARTPPPISPSAYLPPIHPSPAFEPLCASVGLPVALLAPYSLELPSPWMHQSGAGRPQSNHDCLQYKVVCGEGIYKNHPRQVYSEVPSMGFNEAYSREVHIGLPF